MQENPLSNDSPKSEEILVFTDGDILFNQGDVGGDLYFIQQGLIEIVNVREHQEFILTRMKPGEVIGIMTCLTNEPRMASARVIGDAVVKKVDHESIKKLIGTLPTWMNTVIKDFSLRLNQMNRSYTEAVSRLRTASENQITPLYKASRIASMLASCGSLKSVKIDEQELVWLDDIHNLVEEALMLPEDEVKQIIEVFADSGMLKVKIEQEKKKKYASLKNLQSLRAFTEFYDSITRGISKKLMNNPLSHKESKLLLGLVKYTVKKELPLVKELKLPIKELKEDMKKLVGVEFELNLLARAEKLKLIKVQKSNPSNAEVIITPINLSRLLTHVSVARKLEKSADIADTQAAS